MRIRRTAVVVALAAAVTVTGGTAAYAHNGGNKDRKPCPADSVKPKPSESAKPKPSTSAGPVKAPGSRLVLPFQAVGTIDAVNLASGTITVDATGGSADVRGKDVTVKVPKIAQVLLNGRSVLPDALTAGLKVSVAGLRTDDTYTAGLVTAGLNLGTKPKPTPTATPTPAPTATTASPAPTVTVTVTTTQTVTPVPTQTEP
ncbi:hypothetical protein [Actinoplanes sp. G11-F43]|uniref:hypothetical protein n=1 Tax=Actinoplanes sp. G11-F43 TaxID=3424130 RepID=UPI003D3555E3